MGINFGFDLDGNASLGKKDEYKKRVAEINKNEKDKDFYWRALPWILSTVKVSHISKETIPTIIARYLATHPNLFFVKIEAGDKAGDKDPYELWEDTYLTPEYFAKFIGYEVNVEFMDDITYMGLQLAHKLRKVTKSTGVVDPSNLKLPFPDEKAVDEEFKRYYKEIAGTEAYV
jgi:hypothetical protein